MAQIPENLLNSQSPVEGLKLVGRGKVRDRYVLDGYPAEMYLVATDRVSIFDFVLRALIPDKGAVLTALSFFWTKLIGEVCSTDHLACGAVIEARMHPNLRARMTKIRLLPLPEVEDIVRFHLVGTGWSSYLQTGEVCGHRLPKGLAEGCRLPYPIYTPTTNAEQGHDETLSAAGVLEKVGWRRERLAIQVASMMADYAWRRGIILADTKFEFSRTEEGEPVLIDEKGTPDSSRFWDFRDWERAQAKGGLPPALDKQYVR